MDIPGMGVVLKKAGAKRVCVSADVGPMGVEGKREIAEEMKEGGKAVI